MHIHKDYWPEEYKNCYDEDFSLRFAAQKIKENKEYLFTSCSCIQTARLFGANIPPKTDAKNLIPNTTLANLKRGDIIILKYSKNYHIAIFQEFSEQGFIVKEGNFEPCKISSRTIKFNDKAVIGFWTDNT